ncbi:uncharacterized protein V1516DRAFT_685199 [Lipomyces oligophaga]|uniref:uncharacterized protein n=1 Tax=Lipomyces oligophaga TaxID=45792 RepID=UPI0034D01141
MALPESNSSSTRACDSCRSRKIKCDRKEPCMQCTLREVICVFSTRKKRKRRVASARISTIPPNLIGSPSSESQAQSSFSSTVAAPIVLDPSPFLPASGSSSSQSEPFFQLPTLISSDQAELIPASRELSSRTLERNRLTEIEYHFEQISALLDQQRNMGTSSGTDRAQKLYAELVTKANDSLRTLEPSVSAQLPPLLSQHISNNAAQITPHQISNSPPAQPATSPSEKLDWSNDLVDRSKFGLSEEIADFLAIESHKPYIPEPSIGADLLQYFISNLIHDECHISLPLATSIRDSIYSAEFLNDKYFIQKLVCASFMMIQSLHSKDMVSVGELPLAEDGCSIESNLVRNIFLIMHSAWVLFIPSLINVQALYLAAISAQQITNPGLCWIIISYAARHCLDLKLNLRTSGSVMQSTSGSGIGGSLKSGIDAGMAYSSTVTAQSERIRLFWSCFVLDKVLSLTFGRSPTFQTKECSIERPPHMQYDPTDPFSFGYNKFCQAIGIAFMHDAIYTRLYSASAESELALVGPEGSYARTERRGAVVKQLHAEADFLLKGNMEWIDSVRMSGYPRCEDIALKLATKLNYSHRVCLTMIHRVQSSSSAESKEIYIRVSREALLLFEQILDPLPSGCLRSAATSWALVFQPFAPFFGVFNAIADDGSGIGRDELDLQTLRSITFELSRLDKETDRSGVIRRLFNLASEFTEVASEILNIRKGNIQEPNSLGSEVFKTDHSFYSVPRAASSSSSIATMIDEPTTVPAISSRREEFDTELCRTSYSEAARQPTLPSWLEFLADDITTGWLGPEAEDSGSGDVVEL